MKKIKDLNSPENFAQILDAIGDMILVKGPQSKLLWANKAFCDYYGMTNEQLRGLIDAPFSEPDHTQKFVQDDAYVFNTGKILDIPEESVNCHDGSVRLFHIVKTPIFDQDKNVIMTVGVSRDITDRKEAETSVRIERERALYSAKMATLGEMAGGVAHEINTPLAILVLLAEEALSSLKDDIPDLNLIQQKIEQMQKTTQRIGKIVTGLKSFSRDSKSEPMAQTKVSNIIDDTLSFSREKLMSHGIDLKINHEDPNLEIYCRSIEVSQILLNLLNNAHDAIADIDSEKKWIEIESKRANENIEIAVTNSGARIPKEHQSKLFSPFFTTKEVGKGTGLGLSISKSIAESHGGTLKLNPDFPNTRFVLRIPIKK